MDVLKEVEKYYSEDVKKTEDLKTGACITACGSGMPAQIKQIISQLHDEVVSKYYGCGLCIPLDFSLLRGLSALDLGSGSGRDAYILSALVGAGGRVVGVDMTPAQHEVAVRHRAFHAERFGHAAPNTEFRLARLEELAGAVEAGSVDLCVSNCVVNLLEDKGALLAAVRGVLKTGGEFYFSDVYCDRRVPWTLQQDRVLWGECLSGALYWRDFQRLCAQKGFAARVVEAHRVGIGNEELEARLGRLRFASLTYRLIKAEGLEEGCEDYGDAVLYRGTIAEFPAAFAFDLEHVFEAQKVVPVCRNTRRLLKASRFRDHFRFLPEEEGEMHFGVFPGCSFDPFAAADAAPEPSQAGQAEKKKCSCC